MRKRLHTRQIKIEAYEIGENKVLVEGRLDDEQPFPFANITGELHPAGTIHDMRFEIEVSVPDFTITAVRAGMPGVPDEGCREIEPLTQTLVGLRIVGGFTGEVKRRLGGIRGCAHLGSLILAVAPIATLAYGAMQHSKGVKDSEHWIADSHVLNTCHMWREGGTYHEALVAQIAAMAEKPDTAQ